MAAAFLSPAGRDSGARVGGRVGLARGGDARSGGGGRGLRGGDVAAV